MVNDLERELSRGDSGFPLLAFVNDVVDSATAGRPGSPETNRAPGEILQLERDVLHDMTHPRPQLQPREKSATHTLGTSVLDERRNHRLQSVDESGNRVRRKVLELSEVELPLDHGAVGVQIRTHERETFQHFDFPGHLSCRRAIALPLLR